MQLYYVGPSRKGAADGSSRENQASYRDAAAWDYVKQQLSEGPVAVRFETNAPYYLPLILTSIGDGQHSLLLEADPETPSSLARFVVESALAPGQQATLYLEEAINVTLRGFDFTGDASIAYVSRIGPRSSGVWFDDCHWHDMPNVTHGATGVNGGHAGHGSDSEDTGATARNILYTACTFRRIGVNEHAHMMYHANDARDIRVLRCTFVDCAGYYIKLRDNVDNCTVRFCTFVSTGTYNRDPRPWKNNPPFIVVIVQNDTDPRTEGVNPHAIEYFGSSYAFCDNTFVYPVLPPPVDSLPQGPVEDPFNRCRGRAMQSSFGIPIVVCHVGYSPLDRTHVLTHAELDEYREAGTSRRRQLVLTRCGIDHRKVFVHNNIAPITNGDRLMFFKSEPWFEEYACVLVSIQGLVTNAYPPDEGEA